MKFDPPQSLGSLARLIGSEAVGDPDFAITGINEIHRVEQGDLVFVDHPKYYDKALQSAATAVLIDKKVDCPEGKVLLVSEQPFRDFNRIISHFQPFRAASAAISDSATVGEGTVIQPNAVIGHDVQIGKDCIIHPNVTIYDRAVIGDRVVIHANTVIGANAFYYQRKADGYHPLRTCGQVVIEDDVEIGASCTIDSGVTAITRIGAGSKLDNLVHIGHDTILGKHCLIAAQVGIAGCVELRDGVKLWGQVGVISDITIGEGVEVYAQSGIGRSLEAGKVYFGSPADLARKKYRELAALRMLPGHLQQQNET
ncbi:MAG: UDP-3-O-(3-hydroxymyristoyl)glucosamine N-acyltransferase [Bacteroidota bacterium]